MERTINDFLRHIEADTCRVTHDRINGWIVEARPGFGAACPIVVGVGMTLDEAFDNAIRYYDEKSRAYDAAHIGG